MLEKQGGVTIGGATFLAAFASFLGGLEFSPQFAGALEDIDKILDVGLFLTIGTLSIAVAALILGPALQQANVISELRRSKRVPSQEELLALSTLARSINWFFASFLFCLVGTASSLAFDGVLEYQPTGRVEPTVSGLMILLAGPAWADVVEGASSSGSLAAALTLLVLGTRVLVGHVGQILRDR